MKSSKPLILEMAPRKVGLGLSKAALTFFKEHDCVGVIHSETRTCSYIRRS
jgi:hypothetical protein